MATLSYLHGHDAALPNDFYGILTGIDENDIESIDELIKSAPKAMKMLAWDCSGDFRTRYEL